MAVLVERKKRSDAKPVPEKKMKPFKVILEFSDKIDALGFALCVEDQSPGVAEFIREKANL